MFYVCLTVYDIVQKNGCTIYGGEYKELLDRQEIHSPMKVVMLFHAMPNNSEMFVYDPSNGNSYRFSKGTLVKSEVDSDIDQFIDDYIH